MAPKWIDYIFPSKVSAQPSYEFSKMSDKFHGASSNTYSYSLIKLQTYSTSLYRNSPPSIHQNLNLYNLQNPYASRPRNNKLMDELIRECRNFQYNNRQFKRSEIISNFAKRLFCDQCFREAYDMDPLKIKNLYTREDPPFYRELNKCLCQGVDSNLVGACTQNLSSVIYQSNHNDLPNVVFRGANFCRDEIARLEHAQRTDTLIYFNGFTSTSRSQREADKFGTWLLCIRIPYGFQCAADISEYSQFQNEQEILIAANSGFQINYIDRDEKVIDITLADDSQCLKPRPSHICRKHRYEKFEQLYMRK
ncbi:unnamed protein product [Didymodactylos carnosus]|uniref:ADP ribosyltransferase domain-containing protein n=1 Tax=Didymodactylos carnosus TaxID=1234261 RepID=A0A813WR31_9BILA|nr:unnamed protein product [Didymodactylos carnosus]CAF0861884.1 unnamed protein product [Didymodactylos carnosus]CAF3566272.1 unnamed protein product [Didymodactylos carnosus]CAF3649531.1 unnamed protein product [Didymodactylos carnosus]